MNPVVGIGSISKDIILQSVLLVPSLTCNLISVSRFKLDYKYVKFVPLSCQFKNLLSERMIGSARIQNGLYYLQDALSEDLTSAVSDIASIFILLLGK